MFSHVCGQLDVVVVVFVERNKKRVKKKFAITRRMKLSLETSPRRSLYKRSATDGICHKWHVMNL